MTLTLRDIEMSDLEEYICLNHPAREFHKFNAPYFHKESLEQLTNKVKKWEMRLKSGKKKILKNSQLIVNSDDNELIGEVNWYWKSKETQWMEIGIVIFNEKYWGRGIGYTTLSLWINRIFLKYPNLVRLGMTTWSGNTRMMHLAEKLGFVKEAVYRKARIVNGIYYDSVSYGILREEWYARNSSNFSG